MDEEKVIEIFCNQIDRSVKLYEHINELMYEHINELNEMFNCKE